MAELFQKDQSVIARHINNALKEGELEENSNMHFLHNTQYRYRPTKIYDLDTKATPCLARCDVFFLVLIGKSSWVDCVPVHQCTISIFQVLGRRRKSGILFYYIIYIIIYII